MRPAILLLSIAAALLADSAAGIGWTAPAGWISKGSAPMRAATYDVQDSECVIYYFGPGQGGSVQANLARWGSQFTKDGKPAESRIARRTINGLPVTTMDVSGVYAGMGGPTMSPQAPKPDYRMLAAIVEGPNGSLFLKFTGPRKTITANQKQFENLIVSFRKL